MLTKVCFAQFQLLVVLMQILVRFLEIDFSAIIHGGFSIFELFVREISKTSQVAFLDFRAIAFLETVSTFGCYEACAARGRRMPVGSYGGPSS